MKRTATKRTGEYATKEHFRELFTEDMNRLYLLSFLLTADHEKAERCFVAGLDECVTGGPVFREWARTWARRIVVQNAIRMIAPHMGSATIAPGTFQAQDARFAEVLGLEDFERFVYVLSVLEGFSDSDCATLLGVSSRDIREARIRAFRQIADLSPGTAVPPKDSSDTAAN